MTRRMTIEAARLFSILLASFLSACGQHESEEACQGAMEGSCGLEGTCVECVTDRDCLQGYTLMQPADRASVCTSDADCPGELVCLGGMCIQPQRCSLGGECMVLTRCDAQTGSGCSNQETCQDGWCAPACASDADCEQGLGTCEPDGTCSYQHCLGEGACPDGTVPVPGSLACTG